ncbi:MAG TPA: hypothetical protein VIZ58_11300, partial [Thermoanaerobaculia bacterium]
MSPSPCLSPARGGEVNASLKQPLATPRAAQATLRSKNRFDDGELFHVLERSRRVREGVLA